MSLGSLGGGLGLQMEPQRCPPVGIGPDALDVQ